MIIWLNSQLGHLHKSKEKISPEWLKKPKHLGWNQPSIFLIIKCFCASFDCLDSYEIKWKVILNVVMG